jgi:hypothetical protein
MTSDSASRDTRSRRYLGLAVALFAGVLLAVTAIEAQESPGAAQAQPAATAPAATGTGAAPAASGKPPAASQAPTPATGEAGATAPAPPQPSATGPKVPPAGGKSGERFEPTEKVRADFDVSFPVDI